MTEATVKETKQGQPGTGQIVEGQKTEATPKAPATRSGGKEKQSPADMRTKAMGLAALMVIAIFALALAASHASKHAVQKKTAARTPLAAVAGSGQTEESQSSTPIMTADSSNANATTDNGGISPEQMARTAQHEGGEKVPMGTPGQPRTLGDVTDFNQQQQGWQPRDYQDAVSTNDQLPESGSTEKSNSLDKPSLVFARSANANASANNERVEPEIGLGLPTGSRLRAHLEAVATTAVAIPVVAVIDYSYERDGEILVPAGAKALGRVEQADRTGYVSIRFDTLEMPDGSSVPIRGVATDLALRPLKGKVEGTHSKRNIVVRTMSGIGQTGAMLIGQGGLNQPLSQGDALREQMATNIGQVSDEEMTKSAVTERIVVSVPADTGIYIVLEKNGEGQRSRTGKGQSVEQAQMHAQESQQAMPVQSGMIQPQQR